MTIFKNWMVALTLMMGVSLTSCLNSDGVEYDDVYDMVLVNNYMGYVTFENPLGEIYEPTQASLAQLEANGFKISEHRMGLIRGKRIEPETDTKSTKTVFTLKAFQAISLEDAVVAQTKEDLDMMAPETAPVVTLDLKNVGKPSLYNENILVTPIMWCLQNDEEKFKLHKLYLACALDEIEEGETDLVFYLRHDKGGDDKTETAYWNYYGYNIQEALNEFQMKTGNLPANLIIKAHETGEYGKVDEMPDEYTSYSIEYKTASAN